MKIIKIRKVINEKPKQYYDIINAYPFNNFLIKTNTSYIGSHNCFFDEISFQPNSDIEKQKEKAKALVSTASARMQSRFMKGEYNPTLLLLASSKRTEQSFLETYIENKKKNESKTTLVIDEPQWVIRTDKDSPNKFKVALGNKFLDSEVLPLDINEEALKGYKDRGYRILEVPMGYYESFIDDIDIALTDIAGISTSNSSAYISGARLSKIKKPELKNLFTKDIIQVGNSPDDTTQYSDYIDLSRIDPLLKSRPLYLAYDLSVSGDKTGLAGIWVMGKKPPKENEPPSNDLFFRIAFAVSIKAPKGYQVSFEKNRRFIYWLREKGFNIKSISTDSFQSVDTGQTLKSQGFNYTMISVDRVDSDHICKPYQYIKSTIYDERIETFDSDLMTNEFIGLKRDGNGKIDHDPNGINSKDMVDAITAAVYNASQNAEQFAFDYGETLDTVIKVSSSDNSDSYKEQVKVAFEDELKKLFDPISKVKQDNSSQANTEKDNQKLPAKINEEKNKNKSPYLDFGMGPAEVYKPSYLQNGIVWW